MYAPSTLQLQIEVDLLKRSIAALEAERDLADVVGSPPGRHLGSYDDLLAHLRQDLLRKQNILATLSPPHPSIAGILPPPSPPQTVSRKGQT